MARDRILLTARTDNFLCGRTDLDDTNQRLVAFAEVGADVLYTPGLPTMDAIRAVVAEVAPKPVNVLIGPADRGAALAELSAAGVRRVSVGGALYRRAMAAVSKAADAIQAGEIATAVRGMALSEISALLPPCRWRRA